MTLNIANKIESIIINSCKSHPTFIDNKDEVVNSETALTGKDSILDSLGLVSLLIDIEEGLIEMLDIPVQIIDEKALSEKNSPFRTIGTLKIFLGKRYSN